MPDRYGEDTADAWPQVPPPNQAPKLAEKPADPALAHLDPAMIAACSLCDPDGYHGGRVCDHHDRSHQRGSAIAREALDAARKDRS